MGVDLKQSFAQKRPVSYPSLPADSLFHDKDFYNVREANKRLYRSIDLAEDDDCTAAEKVLSDIDKQQFTKHYLWHWAQGTLFSCQGQTEKAKVSLEKSLTLHPAYLREKKTIEKHLSRL